MSLEKAAELLRSRATEDRIRGVNRAVASDELGRQDLLLKALDDKSGYVATIAAKALAESADWDALRVMDERFLWLSEDGVKRDPGCHIRSALALGFGKREHTPAIGALRVGIRTVQMEPVAGVPFDTGAHLRGQCALALAYMRAPDALRDIGLLLFERGDDSMGTRREAARALGILGNPTGQTILAIKLNLGDKPEVIQECLQAVVELEDPRVLEVFEPYLEHYDRHLAAFAGVMLAQTRRPEVVPRLIEQLSTLMGDPLKAVALALANMRIDEAREAVHKLLDDGPDSVRLALIESMAGTRETADRERLERLANSDAPAKIRAAAQAALS